MALQLVHGVTKEAMDSYPVLQLVDNQDLVLVKEDLVVVQEHTKIIQAVEPVVVTQVVPLQTTERILKAVGVDPTTSELAR